MKLFFILIAASVLQTNGEFRDAAINFGQSIFEPSLEVLRSFVDNEEVNLMSSKFMALLLAPMVEHIDLLVRRGLEGHDFQDNMANGFRIYFSNLSFVELIRESPNKIQVARRMNRRMHDICYQVYKPLPYFKEMLEVHDCLYEKLDFLDITNAITGKTYVKSFNKIFFCADTLPGNRSNFKEVRRMFMLAKAGLDSGTLSLKQLFGWVLPFAPKWLRSMLE